MKRTIFLLSVLLMCFTAIAQPKRAVPPPADPPPAAQSNVAGTASADDVCKAVISFLNEQLKGNYDSYLDGVFSDVKGDFLKIKRYKSKINFPLATRTLIEEKNDLVPYRKAEVLMLEEAAPKDGEVSAAMQGYYDQINALLKDCLESNKFEYANPAYDPAKMYKSKATFSRQIPSQSGGMLSNLQTGNTLVAEVHIEQDKSKDGSRANRLYIIFKRQ